MSIEVIVRVKNANTGEVTQVAHMDIWNDETGTAYKGNYHAIAGWVYQDGRSRSAEADVKGFTREKGALALVLRCLEELALGQRERRP